MTEITSINDISSREELFGPDLLSGQMNNIVACLFEYMALSDLFDPPPPRRFPAVGERVSDLWRERDLFCDDRFLAARGGRSYAAEYQTLSGCVLSDVIAKIGVKSMAYEDKEGWAVVGHDHDSNYSKTYFTPTSLGEIKVMALLRGGDGVENPAASQRTVISATCQPVFQPPERPRPEVGALRFVYRQPTSTAPTNAQLIASSQYDGWLWPNGQVINVADADRARFAKAIAVFGGGRRDGFTLPSISGFFKAMPGPSYNVQAVTPQRLSPVPAHQHYIQGASLAGNFTPTTELPNYVTPWNLGVLNQIHNGTTEFGDVSFQGTVSIPTVDFPQVSLPAYSEGLINDGKYRPERYNLAVMVYVGGDAE